MPTINTVEQASVGDGLIMTNLPSLTAGEDFAYGPRSTSGAFMLPGQMKPQFGNTPVHHARYDFNAALLPIGRMALSGWSGSNWVRADTR